MLGEFILFAKGQMRHNNAQLNTEIYGENNPWNNPQGN
jgi:hypothetical protein